MLSIQLQSKLFCILEQRLSMNLSPSIYVNVLNPKGLLTKEDLKEIHDYFISEMKNKNEGKDINPDLPYALSLDFGIYELNIEKLYTVDDNILLISFSPASVTADVNTEMLSDIPFLKDQLIDTLGAKDVTIKVTY